MSVPPMRENTLPLITLDRAQPPPLTPTLTLRLPRPQLRGSIRQPCPVDSIQAHAGAAVQRAPEEETQHPTYAP